MLVLGLERTSCEIFSNDCNYRLVGCWAKKKFTFYYASQWVKSMVPAMCLENLFYLKESGRPWAIHLPSKTFFVAVLFHLVMALNLLARVHLVEQDIWTVITMNSRDRWKKDILTYCLYCPHLKTNPRGQSISAPLWTVDESLPSLNLQFWGSLSEKIHKMTPESLPALKFDSLLETRFWLGSVRMFLNLNLKWNRMGS